MLCSDKPEASKRQARSIIAPWTWASAIWLCINLLLLCTKHNTVQPLNLLQNLRCNCRRPCGLQERAEPKAGKLSTLRKTQSQLLVCGHGQPGHIRKLQDGLPPSKSGEAKCGSCRETGAFQWP